MGVCTERPQVRVSPYPVEMFRQAASTMRKVL